jgi:uncharacterized CHY-type Zn-finger protein
MEDKTKGTTKKLSDEDVEKASGGRNSDWGHGSRVIPGHCQHCLTALDYEEMKSGVCATCRKKYR